MRIMSRSLCRGTVPRRWLPSLLLASGLVFTGCESLLEVEVPGFFPADEILEPANAAILVDGAQADFECALANYILGGGQIGDELEVHGGGAVLNGFDRRDYVSSDRWYAVFPCEEVDGSQDAISVYAPLQTARAGSNQLRQFLEAWTDDQVPNREALLARAAAFSGYSTLLLGEGFCTMALDLGPEISRLQVFEAAVEDFGRSIEAATSSGRDDLRNLALVGRARARVNLGDYPGALADARQVPERFRFNARYGTASERTENQVFVRINDLRDIGVSAPYRGLEFEGVPDPRIRIRDDGPVRPGHPDNLWLQEHYLSRGAPIPIATWEEAQLIIAEAELETGNPQGAVSAINLLHASVGLPTFSSSDSGEIREHMIEERRRELFLQGHHLNDFIRFDFPLIPPPGAPFGEGGSVYGSMTCLPLPDIEKVNNPNI